MKTIVLTGKNFFPLMIVAMSFLFQGCQKTVETEKSDEEIVTGRKPQNPPPSPPFYFSNCSNPGFNGNFVTGQQANVTFTLNYVNSTGSSYPAFTSTTVNGITITAPAGTLQVGTGSISFTASGIPVTPGFFCNTNKCCRK